LILIDDSLTHFRADKGLIKLKNPASDDNIINIKSSSAYFFNEMAEMWMNANSGEALHILLLHR